MNQSQVTTKEILDFISGYHKEHGYAPTVREVGKGVGLASPSTAHQRLTRLYNGGKIDWQPTIARTIRVVG